MGFHLCPYERKGLNTWRDSTSILNLQSQEYCACQTNGWSILRFSALLTRLKDALLIIFDNILLMRLRSVNTNADSPDGTPHSTFIFDLPSAATVQDITKNKLDRELMHRLPLAVSKRNILQNEY